MERELNNNRNRNQLNRRRNNRILINYDEITCFRCNRKGHFAARCSLGNNIRRNEGRVNLMNIEDYEEDYDYENGELNDYEDYEYKNVNSSRVGECKITAYRNNQRIYEQMEYKN
ncbi:unnamed protein product [Rhizophagus irregularis]|nr:unnamed protein product [Rhizophagus irregularis]